MSDMSEGNDYGFDSPVQHEEEIPLYSSEEHGMENFAPSEDPVEHEHHEETQPSASEDNKSAKKGNKKKFFLLLGGVVGALLIGGGAFLFISSKNNQQMPLPTTQPQPMDQQAAQQQDPNAGMAPQPDMQQGQADPNQAQTIGGVTTAPLPDPNAASAPTPAQAPLQPAPTAMQPAPQASQTTQYVTQEEFKSAVGQIVNEIGSLKQSIGQKGSTAVTQNAEQKHTGSRHKKVVKKEKAEAAPVPVQTTVVQADEKPKVKPTVRGIISNMAWVEYEGKLHVVNPGDTLPDGSVVQSIDAKNHLINTDRGGLQ